jgi:hypothetical protein
MSLRVYCKEHHSVSSRALLGFKKNRALLMEAETSTFSSLSSNWVYLAIGALALVLGYFIYKRYFGAKTGGAVSFASPLSAPAAAPAAPAAPEAEVEEYEEEDDEKED